MRRKRGRRRSGVTSPDNCDDLHASDASANGGEVVATREKGATRGWMVHWEEKGPWGKRRRAWSRAVKSRRNKIQFIAAARNDPKFDAPVAANRLSK